MIGTTVKVKYIKALVMGGLNAVAAAIEEDNPGITAGELSKQTWDCCLAVTIGLTKKELYECFEENLQRHEQLQNAMGRIKAHGW